MLRDGSQTGLLGMMQVGPFHLRHPEEVGAAFRLDGRIDVLERMRAGLEELVAEATA